MNGNGLTTGDLALMKNNDGFMGGNGAWVFFLFFLLAWGGNGLFGGNHGESAPATQADLQRGFDTNTIMNKVDSVSSHVFDGLYELTNTVKDGNYATMSNINDAKSQLQACCCETNRNIDALRYEGAKNTCDIIRAVEKDGDATRALITQNTIQELRDNLQAAQLQLGNVAQTQKLIDTLRPCATPAYITCSPYETTHYGCNSCGNLY